ncbi:hypothetical protein Naga_103027g1 [Nannochloropsis gaditana]|uniref:Uncharacterized protein n=1 Tax=Nannochloropsis gaditana TaxID=72520 RepID=W7SYK3_9STRA|nr:hypothetical protein Naga_103027g1 [Nannochloropsis gaditana]
MARGRACPPVELLVFPGRRGSASSRPEAHEQGDGRNVGEVHAGKARHPEACGAADTLAKEQGCGRDGSYLYDSVWAHPLFASDWRRCRGDWDGCTHDGRVPRCGSPPV